MGSFPYLHFHWVLLQEEPTLWVYVIIIILVLTVAMTVVDAHRGSSWVGPSSSWTGCEMSCDVARSEGWRSDWLSKPLPM